MKKVFSSNDQVCHVWASQSQSEGRAGAIYFETDTIYSYGRHYPMARIYSDSNGKKFALTNSNGSTMTTESKHKNAMRSALRGRMTYIAVPRPTEKLHEENENFLLNRIADKISDIWNTRTRGGVYQFEWLRDSVKDLNDFYELTGLDRKKFELDRDLEWDLIEILKEKEKRSEILKAGKSERAQIREQKRLEREAADDKKFSEMVPLWVTRENSESIPQKYFAFDYCRFSSDKSEVETSRGAKVPTIAAKVLLNKILKGDSVQGFKVGHFEVDAEIDNGFLKIGCHKINIEQAKAALAELVEV